MGLIKRILCIVFCLWACCLVCDAQKFSYTYKSVRFNCKVKGGTVCITGFDRKATDVTIPSVVTHNGRDYQVTKVDTYISGDNYMAEKIVIESGVKEIANFSFIEFRSLQSVTLPRTLTKVGNKSFAHKERINFINADVNGRVYATEQTLQATQQNTHDKKNGVISQFVLGGLSQTVYNEDDYEKETPRNKKQEQSVRIDEVKTKKATSEEIHADVDDVPKLNNRSENSFAVIIANENYDFENKVDFALRDGRKFKEYCKNIFGIPEENIRLLENASYNQIRYTMDWLRKVANAYANECKIYVYYAGHGMPDEKNGCAYILPSDGYATNIVESGYRLADLYELLGSLPAETITVFLDACFTGMKRDGQAVLSARSVAILPDEETLSGNVVVFSATSEDETAYSYKRQGHGLFTYYLLKKLKETQGNISYDELSKYILREVSRKSLTLNDKGQTPSVNISPDMETNWKKIKFSINNKK